MRLASLSIGALWMASCFPHEDGVNPGQVYTRNPGAAMVSLVSAVAVTGAHRAATGSCWAICQPGEYCDHRTGYCEKLKEPSDAGVLWFGGGPGPGPKAAADAASDAEVAEVAEVAVVVVVVVTDSQSSR